MQKGRYTPAGEWRGCAKNIAPANGSSVTSQNVVLAWSAVDGALSYDVYVGSTAASAAKVANTATPTYTYTLPGSGTATYYWYIIPKNKNGDAAGCISGQTSFTYGGVPAATKNIYPKTDTVTTGAAITFSWLAVNGATAYDVFMGTSAAGAVSIATNVTDTAYTYTFPAAMLTNTYYWYVVPKNALGSAGSSAATAFRYIKIAAPAALNFPVIGYFPSYRVVGDYPDAVFKMCNVVNYSFGVTNAAGTVDISSPATFTALYAKAKANGAKVMLSVNATLANFKNMGQSAATRLIFIKDIMDKVRQYALDGIDLDYEYPRTTDGTDTIFALLAKQLSDSLHVDGNYYFSAALTPGLYAGSIRDGIKTEVFAYFDFFNIMAYDDFSTTAGENYRQHSPYSVAVNSLKYWIATRGMPKEKCILGLPAYGRNSGAAQVSASYKTIVSSGIQLGPVAINLSDSALLARADGTTYKTYYNGQPTIKKKTAYARQTAGGVMFWEIGHDTPGDAYSLIRAACDTLGRSGF